MERNTIIESFIESKRNAYDMGEDGNQSYVISNFAILNNISEEKSKVIIHDHLFEKFLESNYKTFDMFLQKEMRYKEQEGITQIGSDIPQSVRPEQPIKDDKEEYDESYSYLFEDDENYDIEEDEKNDIENEDKGNDTENENDSLKIDSIENKDYSVLPPVVIEFLENTHLSELSEDESKLFLIRFKEVLQEVIDNNNVVSLIILLLYKARFKPDTLSEGEKEELEDIVFHLNKNFTEESDTIEESYKYLYEVDDDDEEESDTKDKKKNKKRDKDISGKITSGIEKVGSALYDKYPITTCLVAAPLLVGIGTIAVGAWFLFSKYNKKEYDKSKKELINDNTKEDIINGNTDTIEQNIEESNIQEPEETTSDTISSDTETQNEIESFNSEIQEIENNESQIKNELVTETKEELKNPEVRERMDTQINKKREYVKKNKKYWGKDKVSQNKDKKGDTSKDKKNDKKSNTVNKKKPEIKPKPSDTKDKNKKKPIENKDSKTMGSAKKKGDTNKSKPDIKPKASDTKKPVKKGDTKPKASDTKKSDTKPKPNENIDAYKKRTGNTKVPKGYVTDPKTKRITKKKESYEAYKLLF